ncbi:MAG: hypothetical protein ACHREM_02595 [Polyangiales bacterium]
MRCLPVSRRYRRVVQLELNEVTDAVLDRLMADRELLYFCRLERDLIRLRTNTEAVAERCEPWVQWTSAHTGRTLAEHGVSRLGDRRPHHCPQTWEVLSEAGLQSVILGPLSGDRGAAQGGHFLPDPWGSAPDVHPPSLCALWEELHALVQRHSSRPLSASTFLGAAEQALGARVSEPTVEHCRAAFARAQAAPNQRWRLASAIDLVLFELFERLLAETSYAYYTLFLNSVAHYQHHFWRQYDTTGFSSAVRSPDCAPDDDPVRHGYAIFDAIVGRLLVRVRDDDTLLIIASALSQRPHTEHELEGGAHDHRLRDHAAFLQAIGVQRAVARPLISCHWRIAAESAASRADACARLQSLTVAGASLFEISEGDARSLFVSTAITRAVSSDARIVRGTRDLGAFHQWFVVSAIKSGQHHGRGILWCSDPAVRSAREVPVTVLHHTVLRALGVT